MSTPTEAQTKREKHRMAAIRQCSNAVLSLRGLTDVVDVAELNELSSEAEMRIKAALTEIERFRHLVYTK